MVGGGVAPSLQITSVGWNQQIAVDKNAPANKDETFLNGGWTTATGGDAVYNAWPNGPCNGWSVGGGPAANVMSLRKQLAEQRALNDSARERNQRVAAEVADLREGLEMVEEKARAELGMVKPDEILVQVTARR
jgi:cell division protein FtsB